MSFVETLWPSRTTLQPQIAYHKASLGQVTSIFTDNVSLMNRHKSKRRVRTKSGSSLKALAILAAQFDIGRLPSGYAPRSLILLKMSSQTSISGSARIAECRFVGNVRTSGPLSEHRACRYL